MVIELKQTGVIGEGGLLLGTCFLIVLSLRAKAETMETICIPLKPISSEFSSWMLHFPGILIIFPIGGNGVKSGWNLKLSFFFLPAEGFPCLLAEGRVNLRWLAEISSVCFHVPERKKNFFFQFPTLPVSNQVPAGLDGGVGG